LWVEQHRPQVAHQKCPFYGFRWPERQSTLFHVGGNECGLDVEKNGPCQMECQGMLVNFHRCEVAHAARAYLQAGADRIRFYPPGEEGIGLEAWTDRVMR
jgi:hypothetical protein